MLKNAHLHKHNKKEYVNVKIISMFVFGISLTGTQSV